MALPWLNRVSAACWPHPCGPARPLLGAGEIASTRLEPALEACTPEELKTKAHELRLRARQGDSLNSLLVEAFALVREAAKRAIGQRQFDVQIVGGIAIHNRCIAELETGEGKTLVATMPAFLNALTGKGFTSSRSTIIWRAATPSGWAPIYQTARLDRRLHSDRADRSRSGAPPMPATSPTERPRSWVSTSCATS